MFIRRFVVSIAVVLLSLPGLARAQVIPTLSMTPDPLAFPDTRVGESAEDTITVTNQSRYLPTYIFDAQLAASDDFTIVFDGCSDMSLGALESCEIDIGFDPDTSGHFATALSLISFSREVLDSAVVMGRGVEPIVTLSSTAVDFGHQTINKAGAPRELLMTNSGSEALAISSIAIDGAFSEADDCGDSLAAQESCTFELSFEPTAVQDYTGTLTITDDASDSPQTVALSGSGIAPGQPDAGLSTDALAFGGQTVGTTSGALSVTLTSTGTVALAITDITASGVFAATDDCGDTLAVDASCTIDVTFAPTAAEAYSGTLTITDDASDSPQTVALSGTGVSAGAPQASLSTSTLSFGSVAVGSQEGPQNVTLANSGTEDLSITSVALEGEESHSFGKEDNCHGSALAAGERCTIQITFAPAQSGELTATVTIQDNTSDSPQQIALSGTGTEAGGGGSGCALMPVPSASALPSLLLPGLALLALRRRRRGRD